MILLRIRGNIIRTVELFCAVLCMTVVHSDTHTHILAVLKVDCWFRFLLDLGLLFVLLPFCFWFV